MNNATLINQTSGKYEYYTPPEIVDAARRTMENIDLDPASSMEANKRVNALHFFTEEDDGLIQKWFGNVWMNHPFGRISNPIWINKMESEYLLKNIIQACCITFACTSEKWFQSLLKRPQCFLSPRTNYYLPDGSLLKGVTKGSVVTYFGENVNKFALEFEHLGEIKVSHKKN